MSEFSHRLRSLMRREKVTCKMLAEDLGINDRTFNHYLNARTEPKFSTLCAISDTLGINLHWLLTGNGPMDLPDADHPEIQTPPVDFLPVVDRGAEPARTASRAGITSEGAQEGDQRPAPSAFSGEAGFADLEAARAHALERRRRCQIPEQPPLWRRVLTWAADLLGCASLFGLLFVGLWIGEIWA